MTHQPSKSKEIKIYGSTESIKEPQIGDFKLSVNSMWDFKSRTVCFKDIEKTFGGGTESISYNLQECIEVRDSFVIGSNPPEPCKSTRWGNAKITPEIISQLIENGYTISNQYLTDQYKCQSIEENGEIINCTCQKCK